MSSQSAEPSADRADESQSFGYRPQFIRSIKGMTSLAIGIAVTSITVAIFSLFPFLLSTPGPRGIWLWPVACAGQILVALICAQLAAHFPLTGFTYQAASRMIHPLVGWGFGWLYAILWVVAIIGADFGLATQVVVPLFHLSTSIGTAETICVIAIVIQSAVVILSARLMELINNAAVATEVVGGLLLALAVLVVALVTHHAHLSNVTSTGAADTHGYYTYLGPFMLALLLGIYTISTFEGPANFAEETVNPARIVPQAMVRTVIYSSVAGFIALFAFVWAIPSLSRFSGLSAPLPGVIQASLGSVWEHIFLVIILVSYFSLGLVCVATGGRVVFAMSRDERFPGYQAFRKVPPSLGTPAYATAFVAAAAIIFIVSVAGAPTTFNNVLSSSAEIITIIYLGTLIVYLARRSRLPAAHGFDLGRWGLPVAIVALAWTIFAVLLLSLPADFRSGVEWTGILLASGVVVGTAMLIFKPARMMGRDQELRAGEAAKAGH
jgi:amino acid transporter